MFGLLIIAGFFTGNFMSKAQNNVLPENFYGFVYLLVSVIYLYPVIAMLKFSNFVKKAERNKDSVALQEAFRNLKSSYKYIGILAIIMLAIYAFAILGIIIGYSL